MSNLLSVSLRSSANDSTIEMFLRFNSSCIFLIAPAPTVSLLSGSVLKTVYPDNAKFILAIPLPAPNSISCFAFGAYSFISFNI